MTSIVIVPPATLAVSMDAARRQARVDVGPDGKSELDDDIIQAVQAYTAKAEEITSRAFIHQTLQITLDRFSESICLDRTPLVEVLSVRFRDPEGVWQTLDPQYYDVDADGAPGWIVPAPGKAWPATAERIGSVKVQYRSGYGPTEASVPAVAKEYILVQLQQKFAPVQGAKESNFERLLDGLIVYL
jgi:uncharacterized phiE125 gp8 family phage protein